jgi:hypothetical protein
MGPCSEIPLAGLLCVFLWIAVGTFLSLLIGLLASEDNPWKLYGQLGFIFGLIVLISLFAGTLDWSHSPFTREFWPMVGGPGICNY